MKSVNEGSGNLGLGDLRERLDGEEEAVAGGDLVIDHQEEYVCLHPGPPVGGPWG